MRQDVEGQRELIAARAEGKTNAVYWRGSERAYQQREENHRLVELTQEAILSATMANQSIRAQIARSRLLLDRR